WTRRQVHSHGLVPVDVGLCQEEHPAVAIFVSPRLCRSKFPRAPVSRRVVRSIHLDVGVAARAGRGRDVARMPSRAASRWARRVCHLGPTRKHAVLPTDGCCQRKARGPVRFYVQLRVGQRPVCPPSKDPCRRVRCRDCVAIRVCRGEVGCWQVRDARGPPLSRRRQGRSCQTPRDSGRPGVGLARQRTAHCHGNVPHRGHEV
ncbi:hypothetical protein H310_01990, partial [Aphanomyces invadans]